MRKETHLVSFFGEGHEPVELPRGANLSEALDVGNSPLLFGCRTGVCATCLVRVEGDLAPPDDEELELLEVMAPGDPKARLACQIDLQADIRIGPHPDGGGG